MARKRTRENYVVAPYKADLARFQSQADAGLIPQNAVRPCAIMWRAGILVQEACGPGYQPLIVMEQTAPPRYVHNRKLERMREASGLS